MLKVLDKCIIGTALLIMLVSLINCLFIHPSADDFTYFVWKKGKSFIEFQKLHYNTWGGRYIPNAILGSFDFSDEGIALYRYINFLIIIAFYSGLYYLISSFLAKKSDAIRIFSLSCIVLNFSLYSYSQAFYWMPGSVSYTLGVAVCLWCWYFLREKSTILRNPLIFICIIIINGSNEISALLFNFSLFIIAIIQYFNKKRIDISFSVILVISIICMMIAFLAPGNTVRSLQVNDPNTKSFLYSLPRSLNRVLITFVEKYFVFLFLIPFLSNIQLKGIEFKTLPQKYIKLLPVLMFLFPIGILILGIFPSYYATAKIPPERALNNIGIYFYISCVCSLLYFIHLFRIKFSNGIKLFSFICILAVVSFTGNDLKNNVIELLNGNSYAFNHDMQQRDEYLKKSKNKHIILPPLQTTPNTLMYTDITKDTANFINTSVSKYYGLKSIKIDQ